MLKRQQKELHDKKQDKCIREKGDVCEEKAIRKCIVLCEY